MPIITVQIFKKSDLSFIETKTFSVDNNSIIFDALESQDFKLPHGCLAGSCGSCRIEVLNGHDQMSQMSAVETDTISSISKNYLGKTMRLSCRTKALGDVEIKILK